MSLSTLVTRPRPASAWPPPADHPRRSWPRRLALGALFVVAVLIIGLCTFVGALNVYTPADTAFMRANDGAVVYEWVDLDHISRYMVASVIAAEDAAFITREGPVDIGAFIERSKAYMENPDNTTDCGSVLEAVGCSNCNELDVIQMIDTYPDETDVYPNWSMD